MANEGNESSRGNNRRSNMDLNLYLGLPRSPRRARPDLGSDLALSSIPINSSSSSSVASIEDSNTPINGSTSAPVETAESHPPYSPAAPVMDANAETLMDTSSPPNSPPEYTPYFPSYESFNPSSSSPYPSLVDPLPLPLPLPLPPVQELDEASNPSLMIVDDPAVAYSPPYVAAPNYIPLSAAPPLDTPNEDVPPFTFYPRNNRNDAPQFELYRPEIRFRRLIETSHRLRARRFRSSSPYVYHHGSNAASPSMVATIEGEPQPAQDTTPPPLIPCGLVQSQRKDKVKMEEPKEEGSNEDSKEKSQLESPGAHFECNICLEMANEPVVTSCGHLFCWPCLYQWLHVHSDHKECPVCKGEVTESNLTPIYGRGNADPDADPSKKKKKEQVGGSEEDVKIPPRPRGNRVESFRQQFRPVSRRFGEGIASSMRRLLDQQMRHQGPPPSAAAPPSSQNLEASMQDVLDGAHRRVLTRLRARRLHRQQQLQQQHQHQDPSANINNNTNNESSQPVMIATPVTIGTGLINGPATSAGAGAANPNPNPNPNPNSDSLFRDGIDLWHRFSLYGLASTERLAVLTADLGRVVGRFASMSTTSNNNNNNGASSSAAGQMEPSSSERGGVGGGGSQVAAALAADQVSASSTMAVIQGEAGTGIWDEPLSEHPNSSAGSSRAHQRRRVRGLGGASTSSAAPAPATAERQGNEEDSLDVDGEPTQHLRKRRRLN